MTSRIRSYKPRTYGTLKDAATALIEAAGGLAASSEMTRASQSVLHSYTDPAQEHRHMPVDIAHVLERLTGATPITEFLAHAAGCLLLHVPVNRGPGDLMRDLTRLGTETSDVFARGTAYLVDGVLDTREAADWLREIDQLLSVTADLRARVVQRLEESQS